MKVGTVLRMIERQEGSRTRLELAGELDLSTVHHFEDELRILRARRRVVRLDLSKLEFMDAVGLGAVIRAVRDRRRGLARLEVDPKVSPQVKRLVSLLGYRELPGG